MDTHDEGLLGNARLRASDTRREERDGNGNGNGERDMDRDREEAIRERVAEYYRYAALRLSHLIDRSGSTPTNFAVVKVLGSPNTRTSFLRSVVNPLVSPTRPLTLATSLDELAAVAERLDRFGIYSSVTVEVDEATQSNGDGGSGGSGVGVDGLPVNDLEATIRLKERSRLWARTGTDFGNQEGSAYASANLRNVFGGAESIEANVSFGTRTRASYEVRFTSPVAANPDTMFEVLGFGATKNNAYASHDEVSQGIVGKIRHLGRYGVHEIGVHAIDRQLTNLREGVSLAVRRYAGQSRKVSLVHQFVRDERDDPLMPSAGYRFRTTQELAGGVLGGSTMFAKVEVDGSHHLPLSRDRKSVLNLAGKAGFMWTMDGKNGSAMLPDRFQLGGPQTVRGFMHNGIGPRSGRDSLGGDMYVAGGVSLLTPLPTAPEHWPVRLQTFVNGGSLLNMDKSDVAGSVRTLLSQPSVSAGVGLVFKHPVARVEVSFSLPLMARISDRTRKGLSFGLGVDFM